MATHWVTIFCFAIVAATDISKTAIPSPEAQNPVVSRISSGYAVGPHWPAQCTSKRLIDLGKYHSCEVLVNGTLALTLQLLHGNFATFGRVELVMARTTLRLCWLESFLAVIDNGGVEARAAEKLGFSASTVNRDIASLEGCYEMLLFDGNFPRGLTSDGHKFEDTARQVVRLLNGARRISSSPPEPGPAPVSASLIKVRQSSAQ